MDQAALIQEISKKVEDLSKKVQESALIAAEVGDFKGLTTALTGKPADQKEDEDDVDPRTVQSSSSKGVDYDKLIGNNFALEWCIQGVI